MEYIKPLNDDAYPERLGAYVNANPSLGIPGSTVPGEALQHTMTEIINAITAAGLTPDDADLTQLLQAIKQLGTPIGSVLAYPINDVPVHCLECNGAVISRATYPELFAVIGTTYGEGDGSTTFKIPDFRDCFLRGANGTNAEAIGTAQGDAIRNITAGLHTNHQLGLFDTLGASGAITLNTSLLATVTGSTGNNYATGFDFDASRVVPTAIENRPVNFAVKFCIVYE